MTGPHTVAAPEGAAFLKAVTAMSRRRPVVTSRAIYNDRGLKLLEGGVVVDGSLYEHLVAHRLKAPLDESLASEPVVSGKLLRASVERLLDGTPFFAPIGPPGRVRHRLLEATEAIPLPRPVAFQLTLLADGRPALFEHSVQMLLLCAHLAADAGAPIHDITTAAAAGLLHDLGMLHIEPELLAPGRRLVGDERRPLYAHPLTGSMLADRFHVYPRELARAILEHHERLDGSGYPRGLQGKAISPLGRLLSLAEVVCAMFDGQRRHPELRVSLLLRLSPNRYDPLLAASIQRLLRKLPAPAEANTVLVDEALHRLQLQCDLVVQWRQQIAPALLATPGLAVDVVESVGEQIDALQLSLFQAGVTRDQLERLTDEDTGEATLRNELWALEQEVQWQLCATANQLQRRWRDSSAAPALPPALADWLEQVRAMEQ